MRPVKQVKVISSQLEILEEFKIQLEGVLEYTNNVILKGNSWIEETNNETFFEMNKFLINETFEFISRCQDITKDRQEECEPHSDLQEQDTRDTRNKSVYNMNNSNLSTSRFNFREEIEFKQLVEKCQEMEKTISLQSKEFQTLQLNFQEHKNETKEMICREIEESEDKGKFKFDKLMDQFYNQAKDHDKQMSSFIETLHSVQEQIKENEQKSETFMKQQKSTENSFSLRLDEVMKEILGNAERTQKLKYDSETLCNVVNENAKNFDTTITNLQEQLKDLEEHDAVIESSCKKTEESNRNKFDDIYKKMQSADQHDKGKLKNLEKHIEVMESACKEVEKSNRKKFDDVYKKIKSTDLRQKFLNVSSEVENMSKELAFSRQQAGFFAQASGPMSVQMDLKKDQIVTSFGCVMNNIGNHYDRTKGNFEAPCDGLYLCSLTIRFDIGENVVFGIRVKEISGEVYKCFLQTSTINSSASVTGLLSLKQNDQVYVASVNDNQQIKLHLCSYFMCTLICKD